MLSPDWSKPTSNPYQIPLEDLPRVIRAGNVHALVYPVPITGLLVPYQPLVRLLDSDENRSIQTAFNLKEFLRKDLHGLSKIHSTDDLFAWLGLHPYPAPDPNPVYDVPYPAGQKPKVRMGTTLIQTPLGEGLTFSCAACHSARLFGKTILGMTNRFQRANKFFVYGIRASKAVNPSMYWLGTRASRNELKMYDKLRSAVRWAETKIPSARGLDTSLPQVSLSLSKREEDEYATRTEESAKHPRPNDILHQVTDSKPAVWWNLKYKTRWLSDGSVLSGNPVYTNILWNEIGRSTDLHLLEAWLDANDTTIQELTTAVFSSQAPKYTDFFLGESFDPGEVQRGEAHFNRLCARCHGRYEKTSVFYPTPTKVVDVGTDPGRYEGMKTFADRLNDLAISKNHGIVVKPQKGYVPPPLVGIWARWPYFHNNSVPTLCAVLTRHEDRPKAYYAGEAIDPKTDFDPICVGYPTNVPAAWKKDPESLYDTSKEGLSNQGHDERIFLKNGRELISPEEKKDLIVYLKTL